MNIADLVSQTNTFFFSEVLGNINGGDINIIFWVPNIETLTVLIT